MANAVETTNTGRDFSYQSEQLPRRSHHDIGVCAFWPFGDIQTDAHAQFLRQKISKAIFIVDTDLSFGMARMVTTILSDVFRDYDIERLKKETS